MTRLRTMAEAAEQLRVPIPTLRRWRLVGEAPPAIKIGNRVLFDEAELERWIDAHREAAR